MGVEITEKMSDLKEGTKFDGDKLRYDLLHPAAQKGIVEVLTFGAQKYADRNWEKGMKWSRVIGALKRHLAAIESGEDFDPESGFLHIDHVQCCAHFLSTYYRTRPQFDDRPHNYLETIRIGLDLDDVCFDWTGAWASRWGMGEQTAWFFDREIMQRFEIMREADELDDFYLNLESIVDPTKIPFEPHCYITSRPVDNKISEQSLDRNDFPTRPVFTVGLNKSKVDIAIEQKLDIFVDDRYENFRSLNEAGICCFLMDKPHNRRYDVGYKRIKSLEELKNRF